MKRTKVWGLLAAVSLAGGSIAALATSAQATGVAIDPVGGGVFQLDGDASSLTPSAPAGDDWDRVCHQVAPTVCAAGTNTNGATAVAWSVDGTSITDLNASIFTGGGSKDPQDISSWAWKNDAGGLPGKDNLLHAFAARYAPAASPNCPNATTGPYSGSCQLLYFGSDRWDNSGDAQQGFWFLQNRVTTNSTPSGGGFGFNGVHKDGDLLVVSDFSIGGTVSTITVYAWDHLTAGNLHLLESSTAAKCAPSLPAGTPFCGIVNPTDGTPSPWPFLGKSGETSFKQGELYEGGINLSVLPAGIASECFASLESETRSSTSPTATLKDFVLTNFGDCTAHLATNVSSTSVNPGVAVHDTATVTGSSASVTPTGLVTFSLCSFANPSVDLCDGSDAAHSGKTLIPDEALSGSNGVASASSPDVNTAANPLTPGRYCFRAQWPGDSNYVGALSEFGATTSVECFIVSQHTTSTVTEPRLSDGTTPITTSVAVGTTVVDHALITGATGFGPTTGSVNFAICDPTQVSGSAGSEYCADGKGTPLTGNPITAVEDAGSSPPTSQATSSPAVTAATTGVWCFRATYTPDTSNYTGSSDANHDECFTVRDSSGATSNQNWLPNDHVVLSTAGGTTLNGTLDISLHTGSCTGATVYTEPTITVTNKASGSTFDTTNASFKVSAETQTAYWWDIVFTPTSASFVNGFTTCAENTTMTVTDS